LISENFPTQQISDHLDAGGDCVIWLDLCSPGRAELQIIGTEFGLHQLAIEDAVGEVQRTKVDRYQTHLFLSAHSALLDEDRATLVSHEIAVFILPKALITVRKDPGFDIEPIVRRWDESEDLARFGVSFLLHGLLDYLVDGQFRAVESLDAAVEIVEDELFESDRSSIERVQRRSFELRKSLVLLRRISLPMREVLNTLMRPDLSVVPEPMGPYYRDIYDHVIRETEWTESLRDLVTTIVETNLTVQGNRMNLIMKKVTSWAAIIAVPTAITGFYGQNLPYPGFSKQSGFIVSTVLIVGLATLLYAVFRKKDWL
jgi:magnesium transporter